MNDSINKFPTFLPSITSVKNFHNYFELVDIVLESEIEAFMLSALDIAYLYNNEPEALKDIIKRAKSKILFLDSGGFEKHNIPYYNENWEIPDLIVIAEKIKPDIIVAFDIISKLYHNNNKNELSLFKKTLKLAERIINIEKKFEIIIHSFNIEEIFVCLQKLKEYNEYIYAIGIPERNLGASIRVRLLKIKQISNFVKNSLKWHDIHLHLFGCSDPSNLTEYSKIGIEIFDGVHWQDLIINPSDGKFQDYSNLLNIKCDCFYCMKFKELINENYNYEEEFYDYYAINHNLNFYKNLWSG